MMRITEYQFRVVAENSIGQSPVSNVVTAIPDVAPPSNDVVWIDTVGVSVNGNTLTKNAGSGWGNSGGASQNTLTSDGKLEYNVTQNGIDMMCGLSTSNADAHFNTIDYAIYVGGNSSLQVYENGTRRGSFSSYNAGDLLAVQRTGTTIEYLKNGAVFYTSTVASSGTLIADCSIYTNGAVISNAVMEE